MSKFDKLNEIRNQHKQTQEMPISKSKFEQLNEIRTLVNEYQELSPRELRDLLQEKRDNKTITLADMKAVQSIYLDPQKFVSMLPETDGDSWGALIPKSVGSGALSVTDTPKLLELPYKLKFGNEQSPAVKEALRRNNLNSDDPDQNTLFEKFRKKIEPRPDSPAKRVATNAGEFVGASLIPFGAPAKSASIFDKFFKNAIVKHGVKATGSGAAIGGASGMLQEQDVDPLTADLIAGIGLPSAKNLSKGAVKGADMLAAKLVGLGKKSIDLPAALAARNLGVDLPASALTDNYLTTVADHSASKNFITSKLHEAKTNKLNARMDGIIDGIIERTGMRNTPESRKIVHNLYEEANTLLPKDAVVYSSSTHKATKKVLEDLAESLYNSDNEKKVIKAAKKIQDQVAPYNMKGVKTPIKKLTATKVSLNDVIDWNAPHDVKSRIKGLQGGIKDDLRLYGESNPVWYEKLLAADKSHGGINKRLELEDIINNSINHATGDNSSYRLSKNLNDPSNNKLIKRLVGEQDISNVDDLASVTRAMHRKNQRNPNKSGTATTAKALEFFKRPVDAVSSALPLGAIYTAFLDNPNFINRAVDRAAGLNKNSSNIFRDTALDVGKQLPIVSNREVGRQRKREPMTKEQIERRMEEIYRGG